jgi:hypothetical protein
MKFSIALSAVILVVGAGLGWREHQRLETVREIHRILTAEAELLGISTAPSDAAEPLVTKREREDRDAVARNAAAEFVAFAKEMEAHEKAGTGESLQPRIMEMMKLMMSLDASQLKILIAELRASKELKDEMRQGLIGFSIMTLASDHPQAALALFTESADLFEDGGMGGHVISSALSRWAKDDPMAALDWVRKNAEKHPDLVTEDAKRGLVSGAAVHDPKLAFKLIGELGLKDRSAAVAGIFSVAKTSEERTAALAALRDHVSALAGKERGKTFSDALSSFGSSLAGEGFESAIRWIDAAGFTPEELENLAGGMDHNVKTSETGRWIQWMSEALPPEKLGESVSGLVRRWTENDYQAAGTWLAAAPEGPAKLASVKAYADTISRYEPEVAAQWAMTLPAGKDRSETIRTIHKNWPRKAPADKEAAAAFAREHGIK